MNLKQSTEGRPSVFACLTLTAENRLLCYHFYDPVRRVRPATDLAADLRRPRPHHPPHHVQLPPDLDGHLLPVHPVLLEGRLDEAVPGKADHEA